MTGRIVSFTGVGVKCPPPGTKGRFSSMLRLSRHPLLSDSNFQTDDLDRSFIVETGRPTDGEALLQQVLTAFAHVSHPRLKWQLRPTDDAGRDVAELVLGYIVDNAAALGDEGTWLLRTYRDVALCNAGRSVAEMALRTPESSGAAHPAPSTQVPDYRDEHHAFRFPCLTILRQYSRPLQAIKGVQSFKSYFDLQCETSGAYIVFEGNEVLYVGMSSHLPHRLGNAGAHHKLKHVVRVHPGARVAPIVYPLLDLDFTNRLVTDAEYEQADKKARDLVLGLESACIRHYRPRYNGQQLPVGRAEGPLHAKALAAPG